MPDIPKLKIPKLELPKMSANLPKLNLPTKLNKINVPKKPGKVKTSVGATMSNALGGSLAFMGQLGGITADMSSVIPTMDEVKNSTDATTTAIRDTANKALMSGVAGPIGQAAGFANMIIGKAGGYSDASKGLGTKIDTANAIAATVLPGSGWIAKRTDKFAVDKQLANSAGFTGTAEDASDVTQYANAKLLFGRGKANRNIANMKLKQKTLTNTLEDNKELLSSVSENSQDISQNTIFKNNGGWKGVQMGRKGLKIKDPWDSSVIPEGALHARKHHIEDDKLDGNITEKGIPVVEYNGDKIVQKVEVEVGEVIFRKEVSEELMKLYKEDTEESMIEAGKLIAKEITQNTIDKSEEYEIKSK